MERNFARWSGNRDATLGRLARLKDDLEQENDGADHETGEHRDHERPPTQARIPGSKSSPESERQRFQQDDGADRVGERDTREVEDEQDEKRWDGQEEEPGLESDRREPLSPRRPPAELDLLDEVGRKDV